jgi:glycosyltransferase involved in cell wall biosynthesis
MKKIVIFSDTGYPDINGVSTTLSNLHENIRSEYDTCVVTNHDYSDLFYFMNMKIPKVKTKQIDYYIPKDKEFAVHIMTEGVLGQKVRRYCLANNIKYTTSLLTFWDTFLWKNFSIPEFVTKPLLKKFHSTSERVMVSSKGIFPKAQYFSNKLALWPKGVSDVFKPYNNKEKFRALYVGRVSKEKDIDKFLELNIPHKKVVVGDGPYLNELKERYRDVIFKGPLVGQKLGEEFSKASVLVFPSSFDTFGLVMIESIACGTPVAALPVSGPTYILTSKKVGCMDFNLKNAIVQAEYNFDFEYSREFIKQYSWRSSAQKFTSNLSWNNETKSKIHLPF